MVARIKTVAFQGIEPITIDVQVQISEGLPSFAIVGLADKAVAESRERVRSALQSMGLSLPPKRITINLSPAGLQKEGSHYDLPISIGLLASLDVLPREEISSYLAVGELALDGRISSVAGVLPAAIHASSLGLSLICPESTGSEAAWAEGIEVLAPSTLPALVNHFKGRQVLPAPKAKVASIQGSSLDLIDIKGQESAKRALEIAAAGGHNLLMMGPPGSGKSMLAARLPTLLPPLTPEEALEVTMIHSVAGNLQEGQLLRARPFRDPHHSASLPAMVGGGHKAQPGEITLAHNGVLFLDELPEFQRGTLEALRQPLETGRVTVSRANAHITYPAGFQLVAAMNPCRCGYLDDPERACSRVPKCALDYQAKLSGPLLDRIDFHVFVPGVKAGDLSLPSAKEGSTEISIRVRSARDLQAKRYKSLAANQNIKVNAQASGKLLEEVVVLDQASQALLIQAAEKMKLSARAYHRVLRVARTIADLEAADTVLSHHLSEALTLRNGSLG